MVCSNSLVQQEPEPLQTGAVNYRKAHRKNLKTRAGRVLCIRFCLAFFATGVLAGPAEQAKQMHDRLAGVPPSQTVLAEMTSLIEQGNPIAAADVAMQDPNFYSVTLKNWVTPWTNEENTVFAPLNDYSATVIGMVRDDIDFRQLLSGDLLYVGDSNLGLPGYSTSNNAHYEALDSQQIDLQAHLRQTTQSQMTGLPPEATAGIMTTRTAAKAFFRDGTNRAMVRFTLIHHMCTDLEGVKDASLPPDRIRQDLSRSPGGDSRIFANSCTGCHSALDPLAQAFAYYEYDYNADADPEGESGSLAYNSDGQTDPITGLRVQGKYWFNANNFPFGFVTVDDSWDNYWRQGVNQILGWDPALPGKGKGAKTMGEELANSQTFAQCQVTKVFENICLRQPQDEADRNEVSFMTERFQQNGYRLKGVFADAANYCKGS